MTEPKFVVILEKKGRGRGLTLVRPWAVRTFKLVGQNFEYYDGDKLKGTLDTSGAKCKILNPSEADNKEYPFLLDTGKEKVMLNASSVDIRDKCIEFLMLSSTNKNWVMPGSTPPPPPTNLEVKEAESDAASNAAVAAAFASNLEISRLEEENKKLEEERLRQVEEATASLMAEELANMKMRQAAEAEAKQREEQERQVAEMFKGMGAKLRFRAAIQQGKMAIARDAGASMLQGAWRAKVARRKMLVKKAEKERLRKEAYARKIQCRYRARLARKRMDKIKAEKLANRQKIAVLKAQCCWRIFIARKKYRAKQQARLEAEFNKSVARQRGFIRVQKLARAIIARRRVASLRVHFPSVVTVKITKVDGLNLNDPSSSEPFAYVSGATLNVPSDHEALTKVRSVVDEDFLKQCGQITSIYKTAAIAAGEATGVAVASRAMQYVVVTVVDKDGDFLGQAHVRLLEHKINASSSGAVEITLPLSNYLLNVVDEKNEPLTTVRKASTGTITLSLSMPNPAGSMCGWMWKVSESMLSSAWKRRYFVLINGQLQYFNTDITLEHPKNVIICKDVTAMTRESYKGRSCLKITFKADGAENSWMVDFDEDEEPAIRDMWARKIRCQCPALMLADLIEPVRAKLESRGITITKSETATAAGSSGGAVSPMAVKTRVPVSKRMSIFK